ncbi:MAG: gliding motility-associated C-terminal domain-containing protein, partial [Saprospiraceae bacterium]|nr:gliding motility-associated C-terminal domain-containing protein [Saprospiraceae bacterium]
NGTFTSQPIPNNTPWTFTVDDINGCEPVVISGNENCNCLTNAGMMVTNQTVEACEDVPVSVLETMNPVLDPDDSLFYYLHTNAGPSLGTVLGITSVSPPSFDYDPATMDLGTTYYISAVAGNYDGSGGIDPLDGCLDVASGTPVVFRGLPTAAISGTASICEGMSTPVTFTATGEGPFTVTYSVNNGAPQTVQVPVSGTFTQNISPVVSQTITLLSVEDANCSNAASGSVDITVNPNVDAGTVIDEFEFCQGENVVVDFNTALSNATVGGTWFSPSGEIIPGGTFNIAGVNQGTHEYTYSVPGIAPCPNDEAVVMLLINPLPTADAGVDAGLDCDVLDATLGGTGNTPGVSFSWSGNVSDPTIANPTTSESGTYTLTVTTPAGCTDTDQVTVSQDVSIPVADITVSDISCFGNEDGYITINNITGGNPPYLCSFNGGEFTTQKSFSGLSQGEQTIVIQDASGCEATLSFMVQEPEQVTVDIETNIEGNPPVVNLGDPITLEIETTPAFESLDTVIWSPADLIECDTCQSNVIYPTQQTVFKVYVEKGGCSDEDIITVFIRKDHPIYVPSAFSPNGDLTNDLLLVYGGKEVKQIKSFLVFSRWGETVYQYYNFQPNDPAFGWNGKHRDELLNPAVFSWFAEVEFIDGVTEIFEGDVSLIR